MSESINLLAVGDVLPDRDEPRTIFDKVRPALNAADITFCQLEANISDRGVRLPQVRHTTRLPASAASALKEAGFDVVSFAGNHCLDWGNDAFFDTIAALKNEQLNVVGVGANIVEARQPVIVEKNKIKVAFLAYCSILPQNFWAEVDRPGCAPMRAFTQYEQIEHDQPGTPPRIHTFAHRGDLQAMLEDIKKAKAQADVVVMSIHWGIHFVPKVIADYQREVAHAAIDAGVDLILGHHAHILKGVEVYRGKAIFYSLCNFATDLCMTPEHAESPGFKEIQGLHPEWIPDFSSRYNFPPDSRRTLVVNAQISKRGIVSVSMLPTYVDSQALPEILSAQDPRFAEVLDYVADISAHQGFDTPFEVKADAAFLTQIGAQ